MSDRANELLADSRRQSKDALCRASADHGGWCCQYHDGFGDGADIMGAERDEAIDRNGTLLGRLQDFLSLELQHHDRLVAGQTGGGDMSDPWAEYTREDCELDTVHDENLCDAFAAGANAALAAVRPEYDRVCAERDAWNADAEQAWAIIDRLRSIPVVTDPDLYNAVQFRSDIEWIDAAKAAHDRLAAGQTEEAS